VIGLDPWKPALALARSNVSAAGLEDRITLIRSGIESFLDDEGFDLIWLPAFFIPRAVLDEAFQRVSHATRPGGAVVVGAGFAAPNDPLAAAVDDLMTVRSGGSLLAPKEAADGLRRAGLSNVREIEMEG
jgi:predicted O-methyltransferase YrrM